MNYTKENLAYIDSFRAEQGDFTAEGKLALAMPQHLRKGWMKRFAAMPFVIEGASWQEIDEFWKKEELAAQKAAEKPAPVAPKDEQSPAWDEVVSALCAIYDSLEVLLDTRDARMLNLQDAINNLTEIVAREDV